MADSTLDSELFILNDNWPEAPTTMYSVPPDGFTGSSHFNVASESLYKVGTKIRVYCDGSVGKKGWSTLTYLKVGTQNAANAIAAKSVVVPDSATEFHIVTNDPDDCISISGGLQAVALGAVADGKFAFFWTGGVCPEQYVSALGGNYATEGNVVAGPFCAHDLAADAIGFGPISATTTEQAAGYALAADA